MATAIISALTGRHVLKHVGMTGEITLRGRVLPIGGVREKCRCASRWSQDRHFAGKEYERPRRTSQNRTV